MLPEKQKASLHTAGKKNSPRKVPTEMKKIYARIFTLE